MIMGLVNLQAKIYLGSLVRYQCLELLFPVHSVEPFPVPGKAVQILDRLRLHRYRPTKS